MTHNMENYEATRAVFSWERPERYNFTRDVIDRWASERPELEALYWVEDGKAPVRRTYAELAVASRRLANVLQGAGVARGDTVIVILGRNIEWWETFTACLRMGAVISPGTTQLSARDLAYRVNAAGAGAIVTDSAGRSRVDEIAAECPTLKAKLLIDGAAAGWVDYHAATAAASDDFPTADTAADEEALCYFTSGTTGYPKMCSHAHSYGIGHQTTGRYWLDLRPGDLHWNISDTGWAKAAWSSYFGPLIAGATLFVHHSATFSAPRTLELLAEHPITVMCGAPTIYRMLVLEDLGACEFPALRHCVGAGEPLNPEIIETWRRATGLTIRDGYGQTETVILCGSFPCLPARPGSMGKPAPGIELAVIDDAGRPVPPGTEGDIAVAITPGKPQGLFLEYRGDPERTAATRRGDYYVTGDRATVDEDGYFWFVSRADDVILSAGYRIGPFEVESALIEHAAVAESAVVSSPDATRGEVVKAFVVLAPGFEASDALAAELKEHVKTVTAPYKYPRRIEFVEALPKTVSGKIRRIELREREWAAQQQ
ncbi:MAG: AMP-binding protein [Gammaproteobacteria bacterium]|nr:AMP-binding protein [Gammaproteobacteria bacterium]